MFWLKPLLFVALLMAIHPANSLELSSKPSLTHYTLYYPPYWDNTDQEITGLHARLSKRLYDKAGLDVEMESVPYARIHQFLLPEAA